MKCEYPRRKKIIIANGKKLAIVKKKYKKIYHYSLKKTPLFFLLSKEKILNLLINNEPAKIEANIVEYELFSNRSELKIFFDKNSSELLGWRTKDAYSNEVIFLIRNIKKNLLLKNKIFKIPKEENL